MGHVCQKEQLLLLISLESLLKLRAALSATGAAFVRSKLGTNAHDHGLHRHTHRALHTDAMVAATTLLGACQP